MFLSAKTIRILLIVAIILTVIKQLMMNRIILAFANGTLPLVSDQTSNINYSTAILPTEKQIGEVGIGNP